MLLMNRNQQPIDKSTSKLLFVKTERLKRRLNNNCEFIKIEEYDKGSNDPNLLKDKYKDTVRSGLPPKSEGHALVQHEINVKRNERLSKMQLYRLTPKMETVVHELIKDLLKKGFIVLSKEPCSSPVVLIKKKNNSFRICVDYRRLNEITVKDSAH
ncbi:uncharacterized protein ZBAI_02550 [Zygosaccharomyces bailii ISA1307]|nr:uncharacterized protein ZBAI_02550 [Zygosaccharomyces bailii ISA1307]